MDRKVNNSKWYQCCYTNVSHRVGDTLKTGWQQVAVSDDIPSSACRKCIKYQGTNSTISRQMVDEDGNILNLLELIGDGSYLYMIRTQYGLTDAHGRANMFSHAYIFPCEDADNISNPNTFLTIANENFTSSEDEAEQTKNREMLVRNSDFSIESVLEHCGLTDELYLTLTRCVYVQLCMDSITKPLYIEYNGSEEQIRELLYLIYNALPLSARRHLSAVSCPKDNLKGINIVFSKNVREQKRYLVPKTGDNSVLSEAEERRFFRLEYMGHAVSICRKGDIGKYYKNLEKRAMRLGDASASNPEILRIAYKIYVEQKPASLGKEELTGLLRDVLQLNTTDVMGMNFIVRVAREFASRGYEPESKMKARLIAFADDSKDKSLQEIVEQYRVRKVDDVNKEMFENISLDGQEELEFLIPEKQESKGRKDTADQPDNAEQKSAIAISEEADDKLELNISDSEDLLEENMDPEEKSKPTDSEEVTDMADSAKLEYMLPPEETIRPESMKKPEDIIAPGNGMEPEKDVETPKEKNGDLRLIIKVFSGQQIIFNKCVHSTDDFAHFLSKEYIRELSAVIPELESVCYKKVSGGNVTERRPPWFERLIEKISNKKR